MGFYSKQKWFCNNCGKEQFSEMSKALGREWKCCSMECVKVLDYRETLSIMGKEYVPLIHTSKRKDVKIDPEDCYRMCEYCDGASNCTCPNCHKENK